MEFKGTKSPWYVCDTPYYNELSKEYDGEFSIITNERKEKITGVPAYSFYGQTLHTAKANALLISKAPEMLEMLIELRDDCDGNNFSSFREKLEYLIKQATDVY